MGREVVVAVTNGKLYFGPWEQIFYGEFDGRRRNETRSFNLARKYFRKFWWFIR